MPENTLLSLLSGGRYGTSADLPPLRETGHSSVDNLINQNQSSLGLKGWLEKNISKKQIAPVLGFLTGAYEKPEGEESSAFDLAMSLPVIGGMGKLGQGARLMTPKTFEWLKMVKDLKLDVAMSPKMREFGLKEIGKRRDLRLGRMSPEDALKQSELESKTAELLKSAGYRPKYKDAPYRATADLEDLVVKIGALMKPTAKSKMAAEYRHTIDKNLLKAMEEIERTGMSGTIHQGTEANIKNTFRALMDLIK